MGQALFGAAKHEAEQLAHMSLREGSKAAQSGIHALFGRKNDPAQSGGRRRVRRSKKTKKTRRSRRMVSKSGMAGGRRRRLSSKKTKKSKKSRKVRRLKVSKSLLAGGRRRKSKKSRKSRK